MILTPGFQGKVSVDYITSVVQKTDGREIWTNVHPFDQGTSQGMAQGRVLEKGPDIGQVKVK